MSNRGKWVTLLLLSLLIAISSLVVNAIPVAHAANATYIVMNTDEFPPDGVYFRDAADWNKTSRTAGLGVFMGETVHLLCWTTGTNVPRLDGGTNTIWYKVENLTRPTVNGLTNAGWLNAHFVNDGMGPNVPAPDVPQCDANGNPVVQELPGGGSLYYSPFNRSDILIHHKVLGVDFTHWESVPSNATINMNDSQWNADCKNPANAIPRPDQYHTDKRITTLAGWSSGRVGPIMFLTAQAPGWQDINFILLIDPGNKDAYYTGACDLAYPKQSQTLAYWLAADPNHVLMVLAGEYTADYADPVNGRAHAGIQNVLFPAIRDFPTFANGTRNIRSQVIVCNYDHVNHEDMFKQFRGKMNDPNHTACPGSPNWSWNP